MNPKQNPLVCRTRFALLARFFALAGLLTPLAAGCSTGLTPSGDDDDSAAAVDDDTTSPGDDDSTPPPDDDTTPSNFGLLGTVRPDGPPQTLNTHPTVNYRGVDAAWDDGAGVFLVVYGNAPIGGAFLDGSGAQLGEGFLMTEEEFTGANWTQNPRVLLADGGFLASWHQELESGPVVQVRKVGYSGSGPEFLGSAVSLSGAGSNQESPAALAFSTETLETLVVWAQDGLRGRRLGADGTPLAGEFTLIAPGIWVEFPSLVYHPGGHCFFALWMQTVEEFAHVYLQRVEDGTGAPLGGAIDVTGPIEFAKVTDLTFDAGSGAVLATWYEVRGGVGGFGAQRFAGDGTALDSARTVFAPYATYDGYDLAWSPVTGTSLGAFHSFSASTGIGELAADLGQGPTQELEPGTAVNGNFLPRVVASGDEPLWLVLASPDYASVAVQRVVRE